MEIGMVNWARREWIGLDPVPMHMLVNREAWTGTIGAGLAQ
ncbi:hypothetical protein ACP4OV_021985 [Aristida adscensionis]